MITIASLSKSVGVLTVIGRTVRRSERAVYVKVTVGKSIIPAPIAKVRFETYQLAWYLVSVIVHGNPSVHR